MIFTPVPLRGAFVLELELVEDQRGFFARTFCAEEFAEHGLDTNFVQCSTSFNKRKDTLRGMHFQVPPRAETKLIRCTKGAIFDVMIDLRADRETYCRWFATELTETNRLMHYIPKGFAHGFQTLEDDTEVAYQMSEYYSIEHSRGVRWDDPVFAIEWPPASGRVISEKDLGYDEFVREM
jgi:dTDP-4-dehydrorhamnose 3,5-epimerase